MVFTLIIVNIIAVVFKIAYFCTVKHKFFLA